MTDIRWRRNAKELLFNYPSNRQLLAQSEREIICGQTPSRDHQYRRGGVSNPTLMKAQQLDSPELNRLRREIRAVEQLLSSLQTGRRIDRDRRQLLDMVYFSGRYSLFHAGVALEISDRTAKRWNNQALEYVARQMGWLSEVRG